MSIARARTTNSLTHLGAPLEVGFELLPYCNLNCFHCFAQAGPKQSRSGLSLRKIASLLDEMAGLQVFQVYFGGGEPFARPDILDIITMAAERSLAFSISTNGTCLTPRHIERLQRLAPSVVQVSLDGARAETHDRLRGGRSFDQAVSALQRLRQAGIRTALATVACQSNFIELPELLDLALSLQVDSFHLMGLQPAGRALSSYAREKLTANQWMFLRDLFRQRRSTCGALDVRIEIEKYVLFERGLLPKAAGLGDFSKLWCTCPCARRLCTVLGNGDVLPCELMRDVVGGNVHRQSLREIWKGSAAFQMIRRRSRGVRECAGCGYWDSCQGGCAAAAHNISGTMRKADPRCTFVQPRISPA